MKQEQSQTLLAFMPVSLGTPCRFEVEPDEV